MNTLTDDVTASSYVELVRFGLYHDQMSKYINKKARLGLSCLYNIREYIGKVRVNISKDRWLTDDDKAVMLTTVAELEEGYIESATSLTEEANRITTGQAVHIVKTSWATIPDDNGCDEKTLSESTASAYKDVYNNAFTMFIVSTVGIVPFTLLAGYKLLKEHRSRGGGVGKLVMVAVELVAVVIVTPIVAAIAVVHKVVNTVLSWFS